MQAEGTCFLVLIRFSFFKNHSTDICKRQGNFLFFITFHGVQWDQQYIKPCETQVSSKYLEIAHSYPCQQL